MKGCKSCKGKGWYFTKANILTGKSDKIYGVEIPRWTNGSIKADCKRCHGKGVI